MAEPSADNDRDEGPDSGPLSATPRWVKVFGLIAVVVIVVFVVVTLVGRGGHGPGRHTPGGHRGPPPVFEHGEEQP